jgi:hypothetical protein
MTVRALTRYTRRRARPDIRGTAGRWRLRTVGMVSRLSRPQPTDLEALPHEKPVFTDTVHRAERKSELLIPPAVSTLALSAAGLLLIATAYWVGPFGAPWKSVVYFAGQLTIFLPSAYWLVISRTPTRNDRIWLVVILFGALTATKLLYSPLEFKFSDELQHWRAATDILTSGHLFHNNFALPISPSYPGLETVTTAVASLSGLSVFAAGVIVMAAARLLMALAIFLLFERAARSSAVAGAAALVYVTNAHFQFFDAMFVYEAFALPSAVLVIAIVARRWPGRRANYLAWAAVSMVCAFVVIVSHHFTSWLLAAFLLFLTPFAAWRPKRDPRPAVMALFTLAGIALWVRYVAPLTLQHASPLLTTLSELTHPSYAGASTAGRAAKPLFDQLFSAAAVVTVMLGVALGFVLVRRGYRGSPLALALAASSLAYYGVVAMRFAPPYGAEISGRLMPFVFVPVAFVLAVALGSSKLRRLLKGMHAPVALVITTTIFLGGLVSSWPPWWERLPGPYAAEAFERSVDPPSVQAAKWVEAWLRPRVPPSVRTAADVTNSELLTTYGDLNVAYDVAPLFYAPTWGSAQRAFMVANNIRYIVVDKRLSRYRPLGAVSYFSGGSKDHLPTPVPAGSLTKFDRITRAARIYDGGDIVIYDMKGALNAP